jgi:hypothetical protein
MTSIETLGCRIYMTENELYPVADRLNGQLHQVEHIVGELEAELHRLVFESGRIPIEEKARTAVGRIRATLERLDLGAVEATAGKVVRLKNIIDGYEREITAQTRQVLGALA